MWFKRWFDTQNLRISLATVVVLALCLVPSLQYLTADSEFAVDSRWITHLLWEMLSIGLGLITGLVAALHVYRTGAWLICFIALPFVFSATFDLIHVFVSIGYFAHNTENTVIFTWFLARTFHGLTMVAVLFAYLWLRGHNGRTKDAPVVGMLALLFAAGIGLAVIYLNSAGAGPRMHYEDYWIARPYELIPLSIYILIALVVYSTRLGFSGRTMQNGLLVTMPLILMEVYVTFFSSTSMDVGDLAAHQIKVMAYLLPLIAMLLVTGGMETRSQEATTIIDAETVVPVLEVGEANRPLAFTLPLTAFLLALFCAGVVGYVYDRESQNALVSMEVNHLQEEHGLIKPIFNRLYEGVYGDVIFLSRTPPIEGIARAVRDADAAEKKLWQQRLQVIFDRLLESKNHYVEARYIGVDNRGRALVESRRNLHGVVATPESRLPFYGSETYFQEALRIAVGKAFFSNVSLLRDGDVVRKPHLPIIHVATPVFDSASGEIFGVVMLGVSFEHVASELLEGLAIDSTLMLANNEGDYLLHPNPEKNYGFEVGYRHLIYRDFPELESLMGSQDQMMLLPNLRGEIGQRKIGVYSKIDLSRFGINQPLHALLLYDTDRISLRVDEMRVRIIVMVIAVSILVLGLAWLLARRVVNPLAMMAESVSQYRGVGTVRNLPLSARDETGVLARAFHNTFLLLEEQRQKQRDAALRAEENATRIETIVDLAADAIVIIDKRGTVESFNRAATEMFGFSEAELVGSNINQLMPEETRAAHDYYIHHQDDKRSRQIIGARRELIGQRKGGETFPLELAVSKVVFSDGVHFVGTLRDVSEKHRAANELIEAKARAEESARLKSEFLANMSHEIRTPMNGVIGMLNLLLKHDLPDQPTHYARTAKSSAESLLVLINDILDFSKIEAGKLVLEEMDFDLHRHLGDFIHSMALKVEDKPVELMMQISPGTPSMVRGDPGRLRQILTNLVSNAVKFTAQGEVVLSVDCQPNDQGYCLDVHIKDTGIGIAEDRLDDLFQSFTQEDASTTRNYGGTGLGLSIVKQLAELMGGAVSVESKKGAGSDFGFQVQLGIAESSQAADGNEFFKLDSIRNKRILVVDDNEVNLDVLEGYLVSWGAIAVRADSAYMALALMEEELTQTGAAFPIVVLDCQMSGVDGLELGRRIRDDKRFAQTRLIMMTSAARRGDADEMRSAGIDAYFPKPVTASLLFDALSILVDPESRRGEMPLITRHNVKGISRSQYRILLAEDNHINQEVALGLLEDAGFTADVVGNGLEVIHALKSAPDDARYDLVLMDCQMPELDGYAATRQIREGVAGEDNIKVNIIAMTANAMKGDREKCLGSGMNDYLSKPISMEQLETKLLEWLGSGKRKIWDKEGLLKRVRQREDRVHYLLKLFMDETPERMSQLERLINEASLHEIVEVAHEIKGVASNIGGVEFVEAAAALESLAREDAAVDDVKNAWPELKAEYDALCSVIAREIN